MILCISIWGGGARFSFSLRSNHETMERSTPKEETAIPESRGGGGETDSSMISHSQYRNRSSSPSNTKPPTAVQPQPDQAYRPNGSTGKLCLGIRAYGLRA